jgi:multisubunit Na+/H+ antiporter MnhG subunit
MVAFTVLMMIIAQSDNKFFDSDLGFWIIIITLFINIFNPVMLYILSYIAKGKLFIKDI